MRALAAAHGPAQLDGRAPDAWLTDGLRRGQLHELHATQAEDGPATAGFAIALALAARATPVMWIRTERCKRRVGRLYATGLMELGLRPEDLLLAVVADDAAQLRAAADAARCAGLGTVLVEWAGVAPGVDLTATRRLMLAAEASGVTVLILGMHGTTIPSAAATRWLVAAAPSTALEVSAPGSPAYQIEVLRRRGGPAGARWRVEWDRDAQCFKDAPLSGAGFPVVADRTVAVNPPASVRRAG